MANRTVLARLTVDGVEGVVAGFKRAGSAAVEYGRVSQKAGTAATRWVDKHSSELSNIGGSLLKMGAVGAVALGGMAKAAVDWESAWAGVTKTVDGTPEQMAALERGLRDMTKVLPASHEELAAVAEAAGQLGIQTDNVLGFTRTMVDLGETTNLSSDEAATALAQLMNVMGTAQGDVDRLGSAVVALGNDGASTERDIVSMAQRIAAAGNQVGMSEADVLGMASALASVGIEAEAGGTAVSLTLKQIDGFVREGGAGLRTIAETSGMTAEEFRAAWQEDAAGALASFVEGMGEMQAGGEDLNALLADLGIKGIRQSDALLRLAGATQAAGTEQDLLREALELGAQAWEENTALAAEAEKRYETTAAKTQMAINSIKDTAIDLGAALLPALDGALTVIADIAEAFGNLDSRTQTGLVAVGGVATAFALAAGGILKGVTALSNFKVAMAALGTTARTATLAMGAIGIALTVAGIALGSWMSDQAEAKARVDALTDAIATQGTVIGESTRQLAAQTLQDAGVLDIAQKYGANLADVTDAALGSADAMDRVRESVRGTTAELEAKIAANEAEMDSLSRLAPMTEEQAVRWTELSNANANLNAELSNRVSGEDEVVRAINDHIGATQEATDKARQMAEATAESGDAADESADAIAEAAAASQADAEAKAEQAEAVQLVAEEMQQLLEATQAYANELLALSGSQIAVEDSIANLNEELDNIAKGAEGSAKSLDLTTEAGRKNQSLLDSLARASMSYTETLWEQGSSSVEIAAATARAREEWVNAATALGMTTDEAHALADAYFAVPTDVTTQVSTPGATTAEEQVRDLHRRIDDLPASKQSEIRAMLNAGNVEGALAYLARDREVRVYARVAGVQQAANRAVRGSGYNVYSATGNIVDYYATGDIRNRHVAQIAPAGAYRVWAEEETEGEAYIPFRRDTRARSLEIWRETGRRLGVQGFAYGDIRGGSSTTYGAVTHVYQIDRLEFPGVRIAAEVERVMDRLPELAQQRGVRRG